MLLVYQLNKFERINELDYDEDGSIKEPSFIYAITVKDTNPNCDDFQEGWAVLFENEPDLGFLMGMYDTREYNNEGSCFIRTFVIQCNSELKDKQHFCFLNQYNKRILNEEIEYAVHNSLDQDVTIFDFDKQGKLILCQ